MIRTGTICASFLYKYMVNEFKNLSNNSNKNNYEKKKEQLKCLSEIFAKSGGVLSKIAQVINNEYGDMNNPVFSECQPFNPEKTKKYLLELMKTSPFCDNLIYFDPNVFKSGTIGQVHKAKYIDDTDIVLKVQYVGLNEQFETDIKLLNNIVYYIHGDKDFQSIINDIEKKLYDELDYAKELKNHQIFYDIWKNDKNIHISKLIPELCNDKIICMELINGETLNHFINDSTQEQKNHIGNNLIKFIFTSLYNHGLFFSDNHYGNFLIENKEKLYIMDFGCVNELDETLLNFVKNLHISLMKNNKDDFLLNMTNIGIINDSVSQESKDFMYDFFKVMCKPWISEEEFEFSDEWVFSSSIKNPDLISEWNVPSNIIYLAKIPFGLSNILTKMNVKVNLKKFFEELLF